MKESHSLGCVQDWGELAGVRSGFEALVSHDEVKWSLTDMDIGHLTWLIAANVNTANVQVSGELSVEVGGKYSSEWGGIG